MRMQAGKHKWRPSAMQYGSGSLRASECGESDPSEPDAGVLGGVQFGTAQNSSRQTLRFVKLSPSDEHLAVR